MEISSNEVIKEIYKTIDHIREWEKDDDIEIPSVKCLLGRYHLLVSSYKSLVHCIIGEDMLNDGMKFIKKYHEKSNYDWCEFEMEDVIMETIRKKNKYYEGRVVEQYIIFKTCENVWYVLSKIRFDDYQLKKFDNYKDADYHYKFIK